MQCAYVNMAERAELESDTVSGTIRLAGGPRTFRVHAPYLAGIAGLEPAACRLTAGRSAIELYSRISRARQDLNLQPAE